MRERPTIAAPSRTKGFTLLELLLSIGLLSLLLAGMYQLFDSWMQRAVDRYAASDMLRVQKATEDYVLANFDAYKSAPLNTFVEVDINDLKTFNYLPTGYQPRNSFKQAIRVFRRTVRVNKLTKTGANAVDSNGNPIYIYTIEVVTVSDDPATGTIRVPNKRLLDTAQAGGPRMGVVTNMVLGGTTFTGRVTSLFSEWYVDLVGLTTAGYTATPNADGGYLAAYGIVSSEGTEANDSWLYRVDVDNRPELNRMETNLLMNGNQMQNVGTLVADKVNVTGNATFRGITQGSTSETAQAMTVEQAMRVSGATESRINMKDTSGGCSFNAVGNNRSIAGAGCTIAGGEVQVISAATAANDATMQIGTLTADGSAITDITNVTNQTDSRGISTFSNLNGTNLTAQSQLVTPQTFVTGPTITTEQLQTAGLAIGANSTVAGSLTAARVMPTGTFDYTSTQMDVYNQATLNNEVRANAINATRNLYIDNMFFPGAGNTQYTDAMMANRIVECTRFGGRTYCEPRGVYNWGAQDVRENCFAGPGGDRYSCSYTQISTNTPLGTCQFVRTTGASGQAYHQVTNCI